MPDQNKNKISLKSIPGQQNQPVEENDNLSVEEVSPSDNQRKVLKNIMEKDPFAETSAKLFTKPRTESASPKEVPKEPTTENTAPCEDIILDEQLDIPLKIKNDLNNPFSKRNRKKNKSDDSPDIVILDESISPLKKNISFKKKPNIDKESITTPSKEETKPIVEAKKKSTIKIVPASSEKEEVSNQKTVILSADDSSANAVNKPSVQAKTNTSTPLQPSKSEQPKIVLNTIQKIKPASKKLSFPSHNEKRKKKDFNQPASQKNIEKTPPRKTLSVQKLLFGFLGLGGLFVFLFYVMLLWGTISGNASNPLFEALGMDSGGLKDSLVTMTNIIFGILSLILLITTLVFLFRGFMAGKDAKNRKNIFTTTGIYFIVFISIVGIWFFLSGFISTLNSGPLIGTNETLIETTPKNVIDLDSPVRVKFDLTNKLSQKIPLSQVRQINWDFNEDGISDASGPTVTHRFIDKGINNGIYSVKASIRYFSEKNQKEELYETSRQVIINNESVLAAISATPSSGTYPLDVELSAIESKDPDGSIVWYEWDLDGDGEFELRKETPLIKKTFETVGEHKVVLRVTGTNTDDYDVAEKIIKVKNPEGSLRAEINTNGIAEGYAPLKVTFDGSQSFVKEGKIIRYEWITEDSDEPFVGRKMQKVFRTPGDHVIRLVVQNDLGEKHEAKQIIKIIEDDTAVNLVIKTTPALQKDQEVLHGFVPFEVTFNADDSDVKDAFEWQWDFQNDGITDEFAIASKHIFRKPGTYDVRLTIIDANEEIHEKIQKIIVERAGVRAKITTNPGAGEVPLQIAFDGSGSSTDEGTLVDYIWEFPGAEPIHYGSKISYLFKQIGNFTVKLTILTSTGKIATTETIISVRAPNVRSEFSLSPRVGSAPLNVTFNPTSSKGLVREYLWDFGDGTIKKQYRATPIDHTYKQEGKYTIKLRLVDNNGVVHTSEQIVEVRPSKR